MNEIKTWHAMSDMEKAQSTWWDLYKDVHGIRPRGVDTSNWTLEEFNAQINALLIQLEEVMKHEEEQMTKAIETFEHRIAVYVAYGAASREVAIQHMHDAFETDGDAELLEYKLGLPWNYIKNNSVLKIANSNGGVE